MSARRRWHPARQCPARARAAGLAGPRALRQRRSAPRHHGGPQALRQQLRPGVRRPAPDQAELTRLSKRYRIAYHYEKPDKEGNYEVDHSSAVFIFDGDGHARLLARVGQHGPAGRLRPAPPARGRLTGGRLRCAFSPRWRWCWCSPLSAVFLPVRAADARARLARRPLAAARQLRQAGRADPHLRGQRASTTAGSSRARRAMIARRRCTQCTGNRHDKPIIGLLMHAPPEAQERRVRRRRHSGSRHRPHLRLHPAADRRRPRGSSCAASSGSPSSAARGPGGAGSAASARPPPSSASWPWSR